MLGATDATSSSAPAPPQQDCNLFPEFPALVAQASTSLSTTQPLATAQLPASAALLAFYSAAQMCLDKDSGDGIRPAEVGH